MDKQQLLNQQSPPWMSSNKPIATNPTPEWVDKTLNDGERIIPIQIERTPNKTPVTPSLGPQPFYGANKSQTTGFDTLNMASVNMNSQQGILKT